MIFISHHDPILAEIAHVLMEELSRLNDKKDHVQFSMSAFFYGMFSRSKTEKSLSFSSSDLLNTYDDGLSNSFSLFF